MSTTAKEQADSVPSSRSIHTERFDNLWTYVLSLDGLDPNHMGLFN